MGTAHSHSGEDQRLSLEAMERFFDQSNIGLAVTSPDKGWIRVNQRLQHMLGYSLNELHELTWAELTHPDDLAADVAQFERVLAGEIDEYEMDKRFIRKNGEILHTHLTVGVQRRVDGDVELVNASLQDIGDQVRAKNALTASEQRYRLMMESTLDGVWDWRPKENRLYLSPRWKEQLGYRDDELPNRLETWVDNVHPDDATATVSAAMDWVKKPRSHWEREFRMIRKDGSTMHVLARATPILDENGEVERAFGVHVDISALKNAESNAQQLASQLQELVDERTREFWQAETRFRSIADFTYDWEMAWSPDGTLDYVSPAAERISGYPPGALISQAALIDAMVCDDQRNEVIRQISAARAQFRTMEMEFRITRKDGQERWVERAEQPMFGLDGSHQGFRSSIRDITERIIYNEALQREKDFNEAVFHTAQAVIVVLDTQARIVSYNRFLENISGRPMQDYIGKDWFTSFLPKADYDRVRKRFRDSIGVDRANGYINPITTVSGELRQIAWYDQVIRDDDGEITAVVAVGHDVTDVQAAQRELERNEKRFRSYFELGLVGMAITSLEKGWVEFNDRLCEILGYDRQSLPTKTWAELTHPDDIGADVAQFNRVLTGQSEGYSMEKRFLHGEDGHVVHARISARCVRRDDGIIDYFVALVDDVSDIKTAQVELQRLNETLEDKVANRTRALDDANHRLQMTLRDLKVAQAAMVQSEKLSSVGSLAAGVAHELNNPMMGVLNYVDYAHDHAADPKLALVLEKAKKQLERMSGIVRNLLTLSRPDTGVAELLDPAVPVNQAIELLAADYRAHNIELVNSLTTGEHLVWSTASGLQQTAINLLINARDALENVEKRHVRIHVMHSGSTPRERLEIAIEDSGEGVHNAVQHRIFDPFFSTKEVVSGSGLGLSVSASILSAVGGDLYLLDGLESRRSLRGACFVMRLRTAPPTGVADPGRGG